jgi:hypothetical protein
MMDMLKAALPKGRAAFFLGRWRDVERLDGSTVGSARLASEPDTHANPCRAETGAQSINIGSQRKRSGLIRTTRPASTSNPHTAPIHGGPDTAS